MSKLSSASIRLVQKKNRKMKDGTYPIYLVVCFHGRLERKTGVSCLERDWDAKRECVKKSCRNAPILNHMLSELKQRVIDRKNEYEYHNKVYTPSILLYEVEINHDGSSNVFKDLMDSLIEERRLKYGTIRSYDYTFKKLKEYLGRDNFICDELVLGVVKDFAAWLERNEIKINTIKRILACVAAVWNYGIQRKIVSADGYPFNEFKYTSIYHEVPRDYYLEKSHIVRLRDYFLDMVTVRTGNRWTYRGDSFNRLHVRYTKEFALCWFLMMYKLNGSSPIDVALLRPQNCKVISIDGQDYWAIDLRRKKTSRGVHIRLKRDILVIIGLEHFLGLSRHFVYPIINYREGMTDRNMYEQCHHASDKAIKKLREVFMDVNREIAMDNAVNGQNEPLINIERVVMYTCRHSFASHYLSSSGATVNGLASLMARSANTIATYVHQLTKDKEIAEMVDVLPI